MIRSRFVLLCSFGAGLFGQTGVLMNRYDAANTGASLRETALTPASIKAGTLIKFTPPTVVNGRVYVPNYDNAVNVYGLR